MIAKLHRFRELGFRKQGRLLHTTVLLLLVVPALHLFGYNRVTRILGVQFDDNPQPRSDQADKQSNAQDIARFVDIAANHLPFHSSCLARSLVLWRLLRSRGIHSELRIGVRLSAETSPQFEAHAWVECNGVPLNDADDVSATYQEIYTTDLIHGPGQ